MYSVSREYWFSAAHRIEGHPKCGRLHGHNYQVIVTMKTIMLPASGMLIDYGELDKIVKPIIDMMDHRYLVSQSNHDAHDPYQQAALARGDIFPLNTPASTGEYIARFLYHEIMTDLQHAGYTLAGNELVITVNETPKSTATYEGHDD